ncbi:MAG: transporter substrate-binding domain-containing protein [Candidatus Limivicinus sp.]|jgi:ABC-type amino acid transport substrate-binding protein
MKKAVTLIMALAMVFALCACGSGEQAAPADSDKLVMGTSADYAPFEFMYPDENGDMVFGGIDVFTADYVAENMGKELQVENMGFDYLLPSLQKGDYDIVIAAMEETEDRLKSADFSDPYYTDYPPMILVKADKAEKLAELADFEGLSVAAQTATTKEAIVKDELTGANLVSLQVVTDIVNQLVNDKIDAAVLDGSVALEYAESNPDLAVAAASDKLGAASPYCIAVQKGDPKNLLPGINEAIAKMLDEGKIQEFIDKADELSGVAVEVSAEG